MLDIMEPNLRQDYILWFKDITMNDVNSVGGKNASLGEMISQLSHLNIKVPLGFAITADAYREFLKQNNLQASITKCLEDLNAEDLIALKQTSADIKALILEKPFPPNIEHAIRSAFETFSLQMGKDGTVAVRSSATAEDSPEASFAGQQETYLNVTGIENVLIMVKQVYASLFNERAINYRMHYGYSNADTAISVGIQKMLRSDCGASGVMFTLDTESGFDKVILINASYGLGELLVQGSVNPDEFYVYKEALKDNKNAVIHKRLGSKQFKMVYAEGQARQKGQDEQFQTVKIVPVPEALQKQFVLSEAELEFLAKQAMLIEKHYGCPMDIEWAKDGLDGELYILQARPETVKSRATLPYALKYMS